MKWLFTAPDPTVQAALEALGDEVCSAAPFTRRYPGDINVDFHAARRALQYQAVFVPVLYYFETESGYSRLQFVQARRETPFAARGYNPDVKQGCQPSSCRAVLATVQVLYYPGEPGMVRRAHRSGRRAVESIAEMRAEIQRVKSK